MNSRGKGTEQAGRSEVAGLGGDEPMDSVGLDGKDARGGCMQRRCMLTCHVCQQILLLDTHGGHFAARDSGSSVALGPQSQENFGAIAGSSQVQTEQNQVSKTRSAQKSSARTCRCRCQPPRHSGGARSILVRSKRCGQGRDWGVK
jgi:hypothetical protein